MCLLIVAGAPDQKDGLRAAAAKAATVRSMLPAGAAWFHFPGEAALERLVGQTAKWQGGKRVTSGGWNNPVDFFRHTSLPASFDEPAHQHLVDVLSRRA